jgi:hypothetical protein
VSPAAYLPSDRPDRRAGKGEEEPMGLLSDITTEIENYPRDYLDIEIFEVEWPGDVIDVDEQVTFRVKVSNSGPLHVDNLELLVEGLDDRAEVKSNNAQAQWVSSFTTNAGWFPRVPAHSATDPGPVEMTGGDFSFRARKPAARPQDLIKVSVYGWSSSFDHMFGGHTRADAEADDVYRSTVSAA